MKVILLAPTPPPAGGIAGWTERMLNAKLKNNWEVTVVDEKQIGNRELFSSNKIKRNFIDEWHRCKRIWKDLKCKLEDEQVKIVHACIPSTTFAMIREYVSSYITHKKKRKFIVHFRCTVPNTTNGKIGKFFLKLLCNSSDHVMVLNKQSGDFIKGISHTEYSIIPNFVEINELQSDYTVNEKVKRIIYVGGVIESKGALEAFKIAEHFPDIEFIFVGDVPEENRKIAEKRANIVLTGAKPHNEIKKLLSEADIFLFLSHFYGEGFSNALCEAMAIGLPCLVTDWAANSDMVENGKGGFVIPIHGIEQAISAIMNMQEYSIRQKMSAFNKKKVVSEYSQSIVTAKYTDVYDKIIRGN